MTVTDQPPNAFWKVRRFQEIKVYQIHEILLKLASASYQRDDAAGAASNDADASTADVASIQDVVNSIQASIENPFQPHAVARYRQTAYMYKTVMVYLDNLIAWGDHLFRENSPESTNEATQLYVLAANILGLRPQAIPEKYTVKPQTYARLRTNLDPFNNAMSELELNLPFVLSKFDQEELSNPSQPDLLVDASLSTSQTESVKYVQELSNLNNLGLYFCIPRNEKLLSYWDTVGDRLFKIRNSLNIQGVFRQLPLFEPPIDPALLAKAAAAGVDVGAVASGANQPLPTVRFQLLIQKATEICQEVKSLGSHLLSAIEKEDNEALALLRSQHEQTTLSLTEVVKYAQWQEAIKAREGLQMSLTNTIERYTYYGRLLGKEESELQVPVLDTLNVSELKKISNFKISEPELERPKVDIDLAQDSNDLSEDKKISSYELQELKLLESAHGFQIAAAVMEIFGAELSLIPQHNAHGTPVGVGAAVSFGGQQLSTMANMMASALSMEAKQNSYQAGKTAKIGSYDRREQEWAFQLNVIAGEVNQIFKQLRAAQIREAIAEWEWRNHQEQIRFAEVTNNFLRGENISIGDRNHQKTSTQSFYTWMRREVKGLYTSVFQFAFDTAKQAERALQHELGNSQLSYLQFNYTTGKEGLLAGEKLYLDLKRMEMAYHDQNQREYELTKHLSLLQINPIALLQLRATGRCTVALPEALFDMDCPGHYFRRIKSVALTIPCVSGPYTSVNCTLTLQKSSIRKNTLIGEGYTRTGPEDDRFSDYFGSVQSIVTSSAQNDSGLFETNLRDERYLPFENSGVISEWQLQLPNDPSKKELCQFDYSTISDVVLHLRYTAREGGRPLRDGAIGHIQELIGQANTSGLARLFSLKHEFPAEWHQFVASNTDESSITGGPFTATIKKSYFPFFAQGKTITIDKVELHTIQEDGLTTTKLDFGLDKETELENYLEALSKQLNDSKAFELSLSKSEVSREKKAQVFMVIHYSLSSKQA
jgi:hypothetical protein